MIVMSVCMHFGARFARVKALLGTVLIVCALSSVLLLIPWVGWLLSIYCMLRLTVKLTDAELFPDAALVTFIAMAPTLLLRWFVY